MVQRNNFQILIPRCFVLESCAAQQHGVIIMEDFGVDVKPTVPEKDLTIKELYQVP